MSSKKMGDIGPDHKFKSKVKPGKRVTFEAFFEDVISEASCITYHY